MRITSPAFILGGVSAVLGLLFTLRFLGDPRENPKPGTGGAKVIAEPALPGAGHPSTRPVPKILEQIAAGKPVSAWQPGYEGLCRYDFDLSSVSSVPELLVLRDIVRRWGVAEGILYSCVREAYEGISARKMYTGRLERLSREIADLEKKMKDHPDLTRKDSNAGKSKEESEIDLNRFLVEIYTKDLQDAMRDHEASIRDHTGITDPEFYRQIFALTPRTDSMGLDTEGWIKAGAPGAYE